MLKSEKINFLAKKIAPNPLEATFWIDLSEDPQGTVWKWFDPIDDMWKVLLLGNQSGTLDAYTKAESNRIFATNQSVADLAAQLDSKQDKLVSRVNIMTINGVDILNKGNLVIDRGLHQNQVQDLIDKSTADFITADETYEYVQEEVSKLKLVVLDKNKLPKSISDVIFKSKLSYDAFVQDMEVTENHILYIDPNNGLYRFSYNTVTKKYDYKHTTILANQYIEETYTIDSKGIHYVNSYNTSITPLIDNTHEGITIVCKDKDNSRELTLYTRGDGESYLSNDGTYKIIGSINLYTSIERLPDSLAVLLDNVSITTDDFTEAKQYLVELGEPVYLLYTDKYNATEQEYSTIEGNQLHTFYYDEDEDCIYIVEYINPLYQIYSDDNSQGNVTEVTKIDNTGRVVTRRINRGIYSDSQGFNIQVEDNTRDSVTDPTGTTIRRHLNVITEGNGRDVLFNDGTYKNLQDSIDFSEYATIAWVNEVISNLVTGDIENIKNEINNINTNIENINQDIDNINQDIENIYNEINQGGDIEGDITNINQEITNIKQELDQKFELPDGGTTGQVLKKQEDGSVDWADDEVGSTVTGSTVTWQSNLTQGEVIGTLTIDGTPNTLYAPEGGEEIGEVTPTTPGLMTPEDKEKLDGIAENADDVQFTANLSSGTLIGTITINGKDTLIYAPAGSSGEEGSTVSYTPVITSGTKIGTLTIDGAGYDLFAPTTEATTDNPGLMSPEDKEKLDGIAEGADDVRWSSSLDEGTPIGILTINSTPYTLYAPVAGEYNISYTPIVTEGTALGILNINNIQTTIFSDSITKAQIRPITVIDNSVDFEVISTSDTSGQCGLKFSIPQITTEWLQENVIQRMYFHINYKSSTVDEDSPDLDYYTQDIDISNMFFGSQSAMVLTYNGIVFCEHATGFNRVHLGSISVVGSVLATGLTCTIYFYISKLDGTRLYLDEFNSIRFNYSYIELTNISNNLNINSN